MGNFQRTWSKQFYIFLKPWVILYQDIKGFFGKTERIAKNYLRTWPEKGLPVGLFDLIYTMGLSLRKLISQCKYHHIDLCWRIVMSPRKDISAKNWAEISIFGAATQWTWDKKLGALIFGFSFFNTRETVDLRHAVFLEPLRVEGQIIPLRKHDE